METTDQVKRGIIVVLKQSGLSKKIIKILFSKKAGDFYLSFPYYKSKSYNAGFLTIPQNVDQIQLKPKVAGTASSIPLKLSYHNDGQVHLKQTDNSSRNVPLSYKLVEIRTIPIERLSGQHVFTVQFEGMEMFEDFKDKVKNGEKVAISNIPPNIKLIKLVGYAGFSLDEIAGKYGDIIKPFIVITMRRPAYSKPLIIAIYLGEGNSIMNGLRNNKPYIICLSGFRQDKTINKSKIEGIFIYGE